MDEVCPAWQEGDETLWVLERHKTDRNGRRRVVFLTPELTGLCRELAAKNPTGPLFRTARGQPWPRGTIHKLIFTLRKRLGLPNTVTAYGYRHTFATDALARGVTEAHVAELLGHAGTAMLHRHYSHLSCRADTSVQPLGRSDERERAGQDSSTLTGPNICPYQLRP
jgi:integrase